jgi:hypothetical protein
MAVVAGRPDVQSKGHALRRGVRNSDRFGKSHGGCVKKRTVVAAASVFDETTSGRSSSGRDARK